MSYEILTPRLRLRPAAVTDAPFYKRLWTDPQVMRYVGFPFGLRITLAEIETKLMNQPPGLFDRLVVVEKRANRMPIGECKLYQPDEEGVSRTDVKLLPEHWGHHYGVEIKTALVDYLFKHTDCTVVEASPNIKNVASIKMQEAVGGRRVRQETFTFPEEMQAYTEPVDAYIYYVLREDWARGICEVAK